MVKKIRAERLDRMEKYILERESVGYEQLASQFNLSLNTLRHDVAELCMRGNLRKVYGGVSSALSKNLTSVSERRYTNYGNKVKIGSYAGSMVSDGDSLFVDAGTTAECMIHFLDQVRDLRITTHSLNVLERASAMPELDIFSIGGEYSHSTRSFMDFNSIEYLKNSRFDKVFLGTSSILPDGLYVDLYIVKLVKESLVKAGDKVIVLSDSSKFMRRSQFRVCGLNEIDVIITDKSPPDAVLEAIEANGVQLITV